MKFALPSFWSPRAPLDPTLGTANVISRAPEDVVQELREKREEHEATRAKVADALKRLG
ncbi:MAG: hypothetical protein ACK52K_04970, partial [Alphaproteobacteria bacterium]